jgi:hypothetical protein
VDAVTAGLISELGSSAVIGLVGQAYRNRAGKKVHSRTTAVARRVLIDGRDTILPILAELTGKADTASQLKVSHAVKSPEFGTYLNEVAIAVATGTADKFRNELVDELKATLVLLGRLDPSVAKDLSPTLFQVFIETCERTLGALQKEDREAAICALDAASARLKAGALNSVSGRAAKLRAFRQVDFRDILQFVNEYRPLLRDATADIEPASFEDHKRVPLESIYVPPKFMSENSARRRDFSGHTSCVLDTPSLLDRCYRTVVLGDPGAGKSTLSRKIAHDMAAGEFGTAGANIAPFIVQLRRFEEQKKVRQFSVIDYLVAVIREDFQLSVSPTYIEYLLHTGQAFVIFDGLDELLDTRRRREMSRAVETFSKVYTQAGILVTSRKVGYKEAPLNAEIFRTATLLAFDDDDVAEYVSNWFSLFEALPLPERVATSNAFLSESELIKDIRSNALMLSLLCNVYRGAGSIPRNRAELYDKCAQMLFDKWDSSRGIQSGDIIKGDARHALYDVALWVFTDASLADGIPEKKLHKRLTAFWLRTRFESTALAEDAADSLLALWRGRAWVLTDFGTNRSGQRLYKFAHQTFLEYFAAVELERRNPTPTQLWNALMPHVSAGGWDIVAQISWQWLDNSYSGARDDLYVHLVKDAQSSPLRTRYNLLSFGTRNLDALNPKPKVCRTIAAAAVQLYLEARRLNSDPPFFGDAYDAVIESASTAFIESASMLEDQMAISMDEAMSPMLRLLCARDETGDYARDEIAKELGRVVREGDPEEAALALVAGLDLDDFHELAVSLFPGSGMTHQADMSTKFMRGVGSPEAPVDDDVLDRCMSGSFWVSVVVWRRGLKALSVVVSTADAQALFCTRSSVFHSEWRDHNWQSPAKLVLLRYLFGTGADEDEDEVDLDQAHSVLSSAAIFFRKLRAPIDRTLMSESGMFEFVVKPEFSVGREQVNGQWAYLEAVRNDRFAPRDVQFDGPDEVFGAAALLAVFAECERWDLFDHSEDQIAALNLGPLQPLEVVFVSRAVDGFRLEAQECLAATNLSPSDQRVLSSWAQRKISFVWPNVG